MVGTQLTGRPQNFLFWRFLLLLLACGSIAIGLVSDEVGWTIFAVLPFSLLVALALWPEKRFAAVLEEEGMATDSEWIAYHDIQGVVTPKLFDPQKPIGRRCRLAVVHASGVEQIPARLNVSSNDLYRFLLSRCATGGVAPLPDELAAYADRERREFGDERVWTYAMRAQPGSTLSRGARAVWLGAAAAGLIWAISPLVVDGNFHGPYVPWAIVGFSMAMISSLAFTIQSLGQRGPIYQRARKKPCGLVISPRGIALLQAPLQGTLSWDEILDVKMGYPKQSFRLASQQVLHGMVIKVAGSTIVVADIYERPLPIIYDRILAMWKRPAATA